MNPLEQALLGWQCLGSAARALTRPVTWGVWLPLALVRFGTLAALAMAAHPMVSSFAAPVVLALAGPHALHYPGLYRALPAVFGRVDAATWGVVGLWAAGASSAQVTAMAGGAAESAGALMARALRRLPLLWLAELPALALGWALTEGILLWLASRGSGALTVRLLTMIAAVALVIARAFYGWLPALVVAGGHGVSDAWHELGRLAGRGYVAAFVITLVTTLPALPLWLALRSPGRWVDAGHPGWVALLLAAGVAVTLLTSFLSVVALTLAWRALEEDPWHS